MINNKEKNFISAVVYVRNDEHTLAELLKKINNAFSANFNKYEIICVNDASDDNSIDVIKEFSKTQEVQKVSIINMSFYHGVELSMQAGVDLAIGDFVFEFDNQKNDFEEDVIRSVYNKCLEGNDIVFAVPDKKRKCGLSKWYYRVFNKYSKSKYKLQPDTFRLLSRRAINRVKDINKVIPYRKAVYCNCGLKVDSVEYKSVSQKMKKKQKPLKEKVGTAMDSLILFTKVGYKISFIMSMIMLLFTVGIAGYALVFYLQNLAVKGWTTTVLFLSFGFFGLFFMLSIAIKYLDVLIGLNFKNKYYLIRDIEKLN